MRDWEGQNDFRSTFCFCIEVLWSEVRLKFQEYRRNKSGLNWKFLISIFQFCFLLCSLFFMNWTEKRPPFYFYICFWLCCDWLSSSFIAGKDHIIGGEMRLIMSVNLFEINLQGELWNAQKRWDSEGPPLVKNQTLEVWLWVGGLSSLLKSSSLIKGITAIWNHFIFTNLVLVE